MAEWGTPEELERRRRIRLALWAYAYEYESDSLVTDAVFDEEAKLVDVNIPTGHKKLDRWFKKHFMPDTGMWIRKHPELQKVRNLYYRLKKTEIDETD